MVDQLNLTDQQVQTVADILREFHGAPSVLYFPQSSDLAGIDESTAMKILEDREMQLSTVFTKEQANRLRELVYQVEVTRVGYKEAECSVNRHCFFPVRILWVRWYVFIVRVP